MRKGLSLSRGGGGGGGRIYLVVVVLDRRTVRRRRRTIAISIAGPGPGPSALGNSESHHCHRIVQWPRQGQDLVLVPCASTPVPEFGCGRRGDVAARGRLQLAAVLHGHGHGRHRRGIESIPDTRPETSEPLGSSSLALVVKAVQRQGPFGRRFSRLPGCTQAKPDQRTMRAVGVDGLPLPGPGSGC